MILLLSQTNFEYTTDTVYDWITHLGGNAIRVNGEDLLDPGNFSILLTNDTKELIYNDINIDDINIIWYRRWLKLDYKLHPNDQLHSYFKREFYSFTQYFFGLFDQNKWYNNHGYFIDFPSKTEQLLIAKEVGFIIPETLITDNKNSLLKFNAQNQDIVTKCMSEMESFKNKKTKQTEGTFTARVTSNYINEELTDSFFPSLFQKEIKKKFEVRVFYDKGDFFSMAIFSAANKKTEVDFRQYDKSLPNRNVPFNLTDCEKKMIEELMRRLSLETGSLDIVYNQDNKLVFLEVNPVGQFGMVSQPCNYNIEKRIAEKLIALDNEK